MNPKHVRNTTRSRIVQMLNMSRITDLFVRTVQKNSFYCALAILHIKFESSFLQIEVRTSLQPTDPLLGWLSSRCEYNFVSILNPIQFRPPRQKYLVHPYRGTTHNSTVVPRKTRRK